MSTVRITQLAEAERVWIKLSVEVAQRRTWRKPAQDTRSRMSGVWNTTEAVS